MNRIERSVQSKPSLTHSATSAIRLMADERRRTRRELTERLGHVGPYHEVEKTARKWVEPLVKLSDRAWYLRDGFRFLASWALSRDVSILLIQSYLDFEDVFALMGTCRTFYRLGRQVLESLVVDMCHLRLHPGAFPKKQAAHARRGGLSTYTYSYDSGSKLSGKEQEEFLAGAQRTIVENSAEATWMDMDIWTLILDKHELYAKRFCAWDEWELQSGSHVLIEQRICYLEDGKLPTFCMIGPVNRRLLDCEQQLLDIRISPLQFEKACEVYISLAQILSLGDPRFPISSLADVAILLESSSGKVCKAFLTAAQSGSPTLLRDVELRRDFVARWFYDEKANDESDEDLTAFILGWDDCEISRLMPGFRIFGHLVSQKHVEAFYKDVFYHLAAYVESEVLLQRMDSFLSTMFWIHNLKIPSELYSDKFWDTRLLYNAMPSADSDWESSREAISALLEGYLGCIARRSEVFELLDDGARSKHSRSRGGREKNIPTLLARTAQAYVFDESCRDGFLNAAARFKEVFKDGASWNGLCSELCISQAGGIVKGVAMHPLELQLALPEIKWKALLYQSREIALTWINYTRSKPKDIPQAVADYILNNSKLLLDGLPSIRRDAFQHLVHVSFLRCRSLSLIGVLEFGAIGCFKQIIEEILNEGGWSLSDILGSRVTYAENRWERTLSALPVDYPDLSNPNHLRKWRDFATGILNSLQKESLEEKRVQRNMRPNKRSKQDEDLDIIFGRDERFG